MVTNQGEYIRAQALFEQTLAMQRELGNKRGIAWSLFHLAWVRSLSPSDIQPIRSLLTEAEALFKEMGEMWGIAECYHLLGRLTLQQGDIARAHTRLSQSLTLFRELGNRSGIARSLSQLGDVAAVQQDWAKARLLYEESLAEAQEASDTVEIASCLEGVAYVIVAAGTSLANVLWAAQLWGAAEALREMMGAPIPPVERATYEARVVAARSSIGKRIFSAYWVQGRTMTPQQALAAQGKAATLSMETGSLPPGNMSSQPCPTDGARGGGAALGGPRVDRLPGGRAACYQSPYRHQPSQLYLQQARCRLTERSHALCRRTSATYEPVDSSLERFHTSSFGRRSTTLVALKF